MTKITLYKMSQFYDSLIAHSWTNAKGRNENIENAEQFLKAISPCLNLQTLEEGRGRAEGEGLFSHERFSILHFTRPSPSRETPRDVGRCCKFAKQQNCLVRPSSESLFTPFARLSSHARSRIATEKSSSSCLHHLGALFQPQIRSRGRGEVFEVSHPSPPLASLTSSFSCFTAKHSGRKLFINVKTAESLPFTRSCCDVKGIHSPQLFATRTSFARFPHETFARFSSRSANMISRLTHDNLRARKAAG